MKTFGLFLHVVAAALLISIVFSVFHGGLGRLDALLFFLMVFAYKWGRNCYRDLRSDERDDSLPWWIRYF